MFSQKTKGLFVDISEFSVLAARTSGYKVPMVVEEIAELTLGQSQDPDEINAFIEGMADFKGSKYFVSRCGVYPEGRFVRFFEAESVNKLKDPEFIKKVLRSEFSIDTEESSVSILSAKDGSDFDFQKPVGKKIVFCGAPKEEFQESQNQLLQYGLYPERLELSTITTLGGICDYARFNELNGPILCFELTSSSACIFIQNRGKVEVARPLPFGLDSIYPMLQRELGLKDEASARKLFYSNTFDFAEMGPKLLRQITKELQASSGFYEVQTGQTIERLFVSVLPKNLSWVVKTVSDSLGLEILQPDLTNWLKSLKIEIADGVEISNLGSRWMGLFSMMGEFHLREEVESED